MIMSAKQSQTVRALRIGLTAMCATAVYETAKLICVPRMSLVQSNITTTFFAGCVGFCISFIIRQRNKAAQQELLRLAAIVQQSDDAIMSTELDGTVTSWNHAAERIYGYSSAEVLGRHISFCYPAQKHAKVPVFLQKIANGEAIERFETQRLTKNGTIIDVSLSVSAIKDGTGKIVGVSGIARDITADKRREMQLHLQSAALEAAANGIVITDQHGTIVWANAACSAMTGYSKKELLGKNPRLLKSGRSARKLLFRTLVNHFIRQGLARRNRQQTERRNNLYRRNDNHARDQRTSATMSRRNSSLSSRTLPSGNGPRRYYRTMRTSIAPCSRSRRMRTG